MGHAPGGVCPFGVNEGVAVYLDESLRKFDTVYPAAGNGHTAVKRPCRSWKQPPEPRTGWMSARSRKANKALYNKRKGSSSRTSVRGRAPFLIRGVLSSRNRQVCRGEFFDAGNDLHPLYRKALDLFAGAMLYVVMEELLPEMSQGQHSNVGTVFFAVGFSVMMVLDVALG